MATEQDKTNTGALLTIVAVGSFAMVGISLGVTAIARDEIAQVRAEKEGFGTRAYDQLKGEQVKKLAAGTPIERVMHEVVDGLTRDRNSATPPSPPGTPVARPPATSESGGPSVGGGAVPAVGDGAAPAGSAAVLSPTGAVLPVQQVDETNMNAPDATSRASNVVPGRSPVPGGSAATGTPVSGGKPHNSRNAPKAPQAKPAEPAKDMASPPVSGQPSTPAPKP